MTHLTDVLLGRPLGDEMSRWLLFFTFYLHLLFVLIMLGTALIGVYHFLHSFWTHENYEHRWDKHMLKKFFIPKALAIVLGVGPLLVIQTYFTVPFFTSTSLFAPFWLITIVLVIVAFFMIDGISHKMEVHPIASLIFGPIGMAILLIVPGIFVLVLTSTENSEHWVGISKAVYRLPASLVLHWLFRYLHVLGAAMIFGAAFQLLVTAGDFEYRKRLLVNWMMAGFLVQFATGGLLSMTVGSYIDRIVILPLLAGMLAAGIMALVLYQREAASKIPHFGYLALLLPVILGGMLLARQYIQHQKVLPLLAKLDANAEDRRKELATLQAQQAAPYQQQMWQIRNDGKTIYDKSCSFCHGRTGMGDGQEASSLLVPPEQIRFVRADRQYIYQRLHDGIGGTAMPYFTIYDPARLNTLLDYLGSEMEISSYPNDDPNETLSSEAACIRPQADQYFNMTCALCHGTDGRGSESAKQYRPPPPDFTRFSVTFSRATEVIRNGYPGTAMPSFNHLGQPMIEALAAHELHLRNAAASQPSGNSTQD